MSVVSGGLETGVRVTSDVCYGRAGVGYRAIGDGPVQRDLLLDVYAPAEVPDDVRLPALVLAFGGAFHRGSKEDDGFEDGAWRNTAIAEYCRRFAGMGYVCFSVGYRLTGEDPDPGPRRWLTAPDDISRSRIDHVRELLGLAPADNRMLADGMEAAFNDVALAFKFVRDNASRFHVDADRMAIGGFSAGGTSALYAAFACGVPAGCVIALSGRMEARDIVHYLDGRRPIPILQFAGERDLEYVRLLSDRMARHCAEAGLPHTLQRVPGAGHFYPKDARVTDGRGNESTVEGAIMDFLARSIGRPAEPR